MIIIKTKKTYSLPFLQTSRLLCKTRVTDKMNIKVIDINITHSYWIY